MAYKTTTYVLGKNDSGRRLDRLLRAALPELPLSFIYRMLRDGNVRLSGKRVKGSCITKTGDTLTMRLPPGIVLPEVFYSSCESLEYAALEEDTPRRLDPSLGRFKELILHETQDIVFINKPRGLLSHGDGGIDELAKAYYADRVHGSMAFIPAPLHRLDRNTSGVLAVSASMAGAIAFSKALRDGLIEKTYITLLEGELREDQIWTDSIARDAITKTSHIVHTGKLASDKLDSGTLATVRLAHLSMKPILCENGVSLACISLGTGRTHQIRIQAAARGHPLLGDKKYGAHHLEGGYLLHCTSLGLPPGLCSPDSLQIKAPIPPSWHGSIDAVMGKTARNFLASYKA